MDRARTLPDNNSKFKIQNSYIILMGRIECCLQKRELKAENLENA